MAAVLNNAIVTFKDSRWLTLEVCREYQRNKCTRTDTECKYAHPLPHVEIQNGRVTACFDSIKGRCNREKPPCKYLHPPQHLKEQLLVNGRNNLALKNAALMGQIAAFSPFLPATLNPGAVGATALGGTCPLSCSVAAATTSPPPPYLQPSGHQQGPALISLGGPGEVITSNHHGAPPHLGAYTLIGHPAGRTSQLLALSSGQPGAPPTYQLILNHHPAAYQTPAPPIPKGSLTRSPFLNACPTIENGATGPTLFLHNGTALTLATTSLMGPGSVVQNGVNGISASPYGINGNKGPTATYLHRQDRMEVCREYQRGNCKRLQNECKYAHPPDHVLVDGHTSTVTVCIDALKGRCTRGEQCRYFHPPQPLHVIQGPAHPVNQHGGNQHLPTQQQQQTQFVTGVMELPSLYPNPVCTIATVPAINNHEDHAPFVTSSQRLSVDATAFRPTEYDGAPLAQADDDVGGGIQVTSTEQPQIRYQGSSNGDDVARYAFVEPNGCGDKNDADHGNGGTEGSDAVLLTGPVNGDAHYVSNASDVHIVVEDETKSFLPTCTQPSASAASKSTASSIQHKIPIPSHASTSASSGSIGTSYGHNHKNSSNSGNNLKSKATDGGGGPRARKRGRQEAAIYYNVAELTGQGYVVVGSGTSNNDLEYVASTLVPGRPMYASPFYPHSAMPATGQALQLYTHAPNNCISLLEAGQHQQLYLHPTANASNILAPAAAAGQAMLTIPGPQDAKRSIASYETGPAALYNNGHASAQHQQHYYQTAGPQAQIIYAPPHHLAAATHLIQQGHHHLNPTSLQFQPPHHFIPVAFASPATANGLPPY